MPMNRKPEERSLLLFSVWMGILFAVLGISWGLAIQSGIILFDGIYSGFSIILSMLSILALRLINQPDDDTFQFGRMAFEPKIDAARLIELIQTRPQAFRLDGADKLRFFAEMQDPEQRIETTAKVLQELTGNPASGKAE